jgi:hypothetical protein
LQDLLSQASTDSPQKPAPRRKQADLFLDTEQDTTYRCAMAGKTSVNSDVDVSDVSSDEEVASVALSRVGERALNDLLSAANKKRATTLPKRKAAVRKVGRSSKKRPIDSIEDQGEVEGEDEDEDVHSTQSECVDRGKSALDNLLKLAMGRS